jgi:hypothetical protein
VSVDIVNRYVVVGHPNTEWKSFLGRACPYSRSDGRRIWWKTFDSEASGDPRPTAGAGFNP